MPLQLDLRHYETIVAIVEQGTMTAAARDLHSTQSTLSHRLAEAERRLGVRLFDRGRNRRLTPTRAGLATHQAASRALDELGRNERVLLSDRSEITSIVRIGVGSYDCFHWYPEFLSASRVRHPHIEIDLVIVGDTPADAIAAGSVDLVIAPGTPSGLVELEAAHDDQLVLIVSPDHTLAAKQSIEPADLVDQPCLTYNSAPTPGFEYDRFIRTGVDYPRTVTVIPQTSAITELVAAGAGVSILSRWALEPAIDTGRVVAIRCGPDGLPLQWNVAMGASGATDDSTVVVSSHLVEHLRRTHTDRVPLIT